MTSFPSKSNPHSTTSPITIRVLAASTGVTYRISLHPAELTWVSHQLVYDLVLKASETSPLMKASRIWDHCESFVGIPLWWTVHTSQGREKLFYSCSRYEVTSNIVCLGQIPPVLSTPIRSIDSERNVPVFDDVFLDMLRSLMQLDCIRKPRTHIHLFFARLSDLSVWNLFSWFITLQSC